MTSRPDSSRLDRIETAIENLIGAVADLRESQLQSQQEHLQLLRIMAQQQGEIVEIKKDIKGLQTENQRILEYLFGQQGQGSS